MSLKFDKVSGKIDIGPTSICCLEMSLWCQMIDGTKSLTGLHSCKTLADCHCGTLCYTDCPLSCNNTSLLQCNCPFSLLLQTDPAVGMILPSSWCQWRLYQRHFCEMARIHRLKCQSVPHRGTSFWLQQRDRRICIPQNCQLSGIQILYMETAKHRCWFSQRNSSSPPTSF